MRTAAISLGEANAYVVAFHRHNGRLPSAKFAVACCTDDGIVLGVAIGGLPKARMLMDGGTLEVNRVCSDGSRNVCSFLYGACIRAAKALGYWRAITYTVESEAGASLRAAGWTSDGSAGGGSWIRSSRADGATNDHDTGLKNRWSIRWAQPVRLTWPPILHDGQSELFEEVPA